MADNNYHSAFEINRAAPAFEYVWDATLDDGRGMWRPLSSDDFAGGGGGGGSGTVTVDNGPVIKAIGSGVSNSSGINLTLVGLNSKIDTLNGKIDTLNSAVSSGADALSVTCSTVFTGSLAASDAASLHTVFGYNSGISQYLRVFDGTSSAGTLIGVIAIGAANNFSVDFTSKGAAVEDGVFVALSTSPNSQVNSSSNAIITIVWK
jgi:hypothetical protein